MGICQPRAATAQEGAIPPPLRRVGVRRAGASRARERHRLEKEGKKEIIYINLLSTIGNPKYLMRKAPMEKDGKSEFKREIVYTTCRSA
ncbi:hypothetical protein ACQJBY_018459 [Aegilops geniculata]